MEKKRRQRIGRLKTPQDVARYMARCIKQAERGGEETKQYKLVCMASMLLKAVEVADIEKRIEALEGRADNDKKL